VSARTLRIGTRASALALWQANRVSALIAAQPGAPKVELVHIRTEGDMRTDVPLWAVDGRAFFTKEIDRALLANEIDIAVHSLKDVSTLMEEGIALAAVMEREDPRDALISRNGASLADLPPRARVGTSSLRRRAFLARIRPDVVQMELRGNVPTRIEKLEKGDYDAIILATAGLKRLGLDRHISAHLPTLDFPSAVSQGAIGVCARSSDAEALRWLQALDHGATRLAATAERALLRKIEGGCQVPLGALATLDGNSLHLYAAVCSLDGKQFISAEASVAISEGLRSRVVEQAVADAEAAAISAAAAAPPGAAAPIAVADPRAAAGAGFALSASADALENAVALGLQVAQQLLDQGAGAVVASQREARRTAEAP
jgi:hydroxymethylbilane synthase